MAKKAKKFEEIGITEEELYAVGELMRRKDIESLPPEDELRKCHTFSEEFERKMEGILAMLDEPEQKRRPKKKKK